MFVTQQYESYVKAVGDYKNTSVPLGSTVNLSCFFQGNFIKYEKNYGQKSL